MDFPRRVGENQGGPGHVEEDEVNRGRDGVGGVVKVGDDGDGEYDVHGDEEPKEYELMVDIWCWQSSGNGRVERREMGVGEGRDVVVMFGETRPEGVEG